MTGQCVKGLGVRLIGAVLLPLILAVLGWTVFGWGWAVNVGILLVGAALVTVVWMVGKPLRVVALLGFRIGTSLLVAALAVLGWAVFGWPESLALALAIMGGLITAQTLGSYMWASPGGNAAAEVPPAGAAEAAPAPNPWADAAQLAITTQGIVLGLISFSGGSSETTTVKVGGASLAVGVLLASTLYLLVANGPPPDANRRHVASYLLSLMLWALGFGLVCVVTGSW